MSGKQKPKTLVEAQQEFADAMTQSWKLIEAEYLRAAKKMLDIWKRVNSGGDE